MNLTSRYQLVKCQLFINSTQFLQWLIGLYNNIGLRLGAPANKKVQAKCVMVMLNSQAWHGCQICLCIHGNTCATIYHTTNPIHQISFVVGLPTQRDQSTMTPQKLSLTLLFSLHCTSNSLGLHSISPTLKHWISSKNNKTHF